MIEHHCKYVDPELHKSEIEKLGLKAQDKDWEV
jgi:hypothetical protein